MSREIVLRRCPECKGDLLVVDIDFEGYDVYGCEDCGYREE